MPPQWRFDDATNGTPKWNLNAFGGGLTAFTWDQMEIFFATNFPNHGVLRAGIEELGAAGPPVLGGCTWYDNLVVRQNSLDDWGDTAGVRGTCVPTPAGV